MEGRPSGLHEALRRLRPQRQSARARDRGQPETPRTKGRSPGLPIRLASLAASRLSAARPRPELRGHGPAIKRPQRKTSVMSRVQSPGLSLAVAVKSTSLVCAPVPSMATCSDSTTNGDETDVDCGGGSCPSCGPGDGCNTASDCTTAICQGGTCQLPSSLTPFVALASAGNTRLRSRGRLACVHG
jgi:hypothetical protein